MSHPFTSFLHPTVEQLVIRVVNAIEFDVNWCAGTNRGGGRSRQARLLRSPCRLLARPAGPGEATLGTEELGKTEAQTQWMSMEKAPLDILVCLAMEITSSRTEDSEQDQMP